MPKKLPPVALPTLASIVLMVAPDCFIVNLTTRFLVCRVNRTHA